MIDLESQSRSLELPLFDRPSVTYYRETEMYRLHAMLTDIANSGVVANFGTGGTLGNPLPLIRLLSPPLLCLFLAFYPVLPPLLSRRSRLP